MNAQNWTDYRDEEMPSDKLSFLLCAVEEPYACACAYSYKYNLS